MSTPTSYRAAQHADAALLASLGRLFFQESKYSEVCAYDEQAARSFIEAMIAHGIVLLALRGLDIVGFIGGTIAGPWFNPTARVATEYAWWVHPDVRGTTVALRLLADFERWGREHGAEFINLTDLARIDSPAGEMLGRMGYALVERAHLKAA